MQEQEREHEHESQGPQPSAEQGVPAGPSALHDALLAATKAATENPTYRARGHATFLLGPTRTGPSPALWKRMVDSVGEDRLIVIDLGSGRQQVLIADKS